MRVVAGDAGGRRLVSPEGTQTRPTSDRVRESIFNMLFSLGAIEGATVLDLYAGSGALGIEALSRGAEHCTFVERDREAIDCIEENLETLGYTGRSTVVATDVSHWLSAGRGPFGLVLIDPPYAEENWEQLLDQVDGEILVAESGSPIAEHHRWNVARDKAYGATFVTVLTQQVPAQ